MLVRTFLSRSDAFFISCKAARFLKTSWYTEVSENRVMQWVATDYLADNLKSTGFEGNWPRMCCKNLAHWHVMQTFEVSLFSK